MIATVFDQLAPYGMGLAITIVVGQFAVAELVKSPSLLVAKPLGVEALGKIRR